MSHPRTLTLTEVSRRLGEPQHRLIHLCERGVVKPDHRDARGRGSSRAFSHRNLLEFAIALRLRAMNQPLGVAAVAIHVLRRFEQEVGKQIKGFRLPEGLRGDRAPDLRLVLSDGERLFFQLGSKGQVPKVFGGVPIGGDQKGPAENLRDTAGVSTTRAGRGASGSFGGPEGSRYARLEVPADIGRPYYRARTSIDALALVESPSSEAGAPGSNSLRTWARQCLSAGDSGHLALSM